MCCMYAFVFRFLVLQKDVVDYIRMHSGTGALHVPLARHTAELFPVKMYLCRAVMSFSQFMRRIQIKRHNV